MATIKLTGFNTSTGRNATAGDNDVVDLQGSLTIGNDVNDAVVFNAEIDSHFIPDDNNTYDLGSASKKWRNGYFDQIYSKQRDIKIARYNTDNTNTRFIRWVTTGVNNNTEASGSSCLIVPKDGTLDSVHIRTKSISNSTDIRFHRVGNTVGIPIALSNFTTIETQTVNINASNTVFVANFSSSTFSAGDIIGISVDPTNATDDVLMTIVLTFDWNS